MWSAKSKTKRIGTLAIALVASFILIGAGATDEKSTFPLYVNVEQDGKPVTGLSAENFRVFLDGRGQEFALEVAETPASVVLLVEQGPGSYWTDIRSAIEGFLEYASKEHWYALVTFNRETRVARDFTKGKSGIASGFSEVPQSQWDEIATYDALANTLDTISRLPGRRVIIFVGSGLDTFSGHGFGDVEKRLESTDVVVFSVGTGIAQNTDSPSYSNMFHDLELLQARSFHRMLADKSGGEAWFPGFDPAFRSAMQRLFQDLSTQYKLVVKETIPADSRFHKVKVEAFTILNDKRKSFKVRVREGLRSAGDSSH
jgi:VWFA-related protein